MLLVCCLPVRADLTENEARDVCERARAALATLGMPTTAPVRYQHADHIDWWTDSPREDLAAGETKFILTQVEVGTSATAEKAEFDRWIKNLGAHGPMAEFMRTKDDAGYTYYDSGSTATWRCGYVWLKLTWRAGGGSAGFGGSDAYAARALNEVRAMAPKIHSLFAEKGICEPKAQKLEAQPHWAGPATKLEMELLGDSPIREGRADFGPGIEQYRSADQINEPDTSRPLGRVYGLHCYLKVAANAPLGERDITVTDKDGVKSIGRFAVHPLVVVLDVDGLRADVLAHLVEGTDPVGTATNLVRLLGKRTGNRTGGGLAMTGFQNGVLLDKAITTFPSYTFPAQASFVTGVEPGIHGIVGNAFFDRSSARNYGLDGSEGGVVFAADASAVYQEGLASKLLTAPTIYEEIRRRNMLFPVLSIFHQYAAGVPDKDWIRGDVIDQITFLPAMTTHWYDRNAQEELMKRLRLLHPTGEKPVRAEQWPSIIWVYLPGVDHYSHKVDQDIYLKQLAEYRDRIDSLLKPVLDFFDDYPGTIFMLASDHGHTDTRNARDIGWEQWRWFLGPEYAMWDKDKDIDKSDVVVRLNGGLAHVYVNAVSAKEDPNCGRRWAEPPPFARVLDTANQIAKANLIQFPPKEIGPNPHFDLVLVRNTERDGWNGRYSVVVPIQGSGVPQLENPESYLGRTGNAFGVRLGWQNTPEDIAFLAKRFDDLSCMRSGDILVLPHYPPPAKQRVEGEQYYHTTGGNYASQHGSMSMDDMHMSFMVAQPKCGDPSQLIQVLQRAVANPARPRITDVAPVIAAFCEERFTAPSRPTTTGSGNLTDGTGGGRPPSAHKPPVGGATPAGSTTGQPKPPVQTDLDLIPVFPKADVDKLSARVGKGSVSADASRQSVQVSEEAQAQGAIGEFAKAEGLWAKALQLDPNNVGAWVGLGKNYMDDAQYAEAAKAIRVGIRVDPRDPMPRHYLALALLMEGRKDEALKEARKAKELGDPMADEIIGMIQGE
ncbi:MAG: alkaline phosphatase family protein [Armatimonadia bacterium]